MDFFKTRPNVQEITVWRKMLILIRSINLIYIIFDIVNIKRNKRKHILTGSAYFICTARSFSTIGLFLKEMNVKVNEVCKTAKKAFGAYVSCIAVL
jgi:hypothetical protein